MEHKHRYPKEISDLPDDTAYAIFIPTSTHVEGDLRSKTNPGHGYPAHDVKSWDIRVFDDKKEFQQEVIDLSGLNPERPYSKQRFYACTIKPVQIETKVHIETLE